MFLDSIAETKRIAKHLTPQQRLVWQRLTDAPADAVTAAGCVRISYLATAWPGGTDALGWQTLVRVTIHHMNKRLEARRVPVRIVGTRGRTGGYAVVTTKERAA